MLTSSNGQVLTFKRFNKLFLVICLYNNFNPRQEDLLSSYQNRAHK